MEIPDLKDFDGDPEEWPSELYLYFGVTFQKLRESGDKDGYAALVKRMTAEALKAAKLGIENELLWQLVARCTTEPEARKKYFLRAHRLLIATLKKQQDEMNYDEAARDRFEAGMMLREVAIIHEAQGNLAAAAKFYTRALTHLHEASDLMEIHFLTDNSDNLEGETFPVRPRLLAELERVQKRMGRKS